jgi:hypothetical protein
MVLLHYAPDRLAAHEGSLEIDIDDVHPIGHAEFAGGYVLGDTGTVHENIYVSELLQGARNKIVDIDLFSDIALDAYGIPPGLRDDGCGFICSRGIDIRAHHRGSKLRKTFCHRPAQACDAGDDGDTSRQIEYALHRHIACLIV